MAEVTKTNIQTDVPAENQSVERCLTFESGDMTLFLSINNVTEIINDCAITHLPLVPDYIKGLTDIGDRYSKNRITYCYLHAVNNSQSQRDLHGNGSSFTVGTGYRNDTT